MASNLQTLAEEIVEATSEKRKPDRGIASICIIYLLVIMFFLFWSLFDVWIEQFTLARIVRYNLEPLSRPDFQLIFFTVVGGGIGGIINGLRSALQWYPTFGRKFIWKYLLAPWLGMSLALIVYALLTSGMAVLGGADGEIVESSRLLALFSVGALAGYGSHDVFIWMDAQVSRLFKPDGSGGLSFAQKDSDSDDDDDEEDRDANTETIILEATAGDAVVETGTKEPAPHIGEAATTEGNGPD